MTDPENDDSIDPASPFPDPIEIPIEESIDLHLFRPSEIADVVEGYLEAAIEKRFRDRMPSTLLRLTPQGRAAFKEYRERMSRVFETLPE